jgi:hypothetical protein
MIHITGARALAMSVVAVPFGWWIATNSAASMARYRTLSHEALLTELASESSTSIPEGIAGALFAVVAVTIAVDVVTHFFSVIWKRIGPAREPSL